ncbi:WbuC family cupin fold metalloprotein [Pseudomonas chlororaphis]|uniref:WbuC family cupin fold metalloprotein n=1 Tax=Pseudomonas chlororaphis TaxID=587753 RepID=UPI0023680B2D|nr:WbuC family cupin fold metalloprotein [Pseudomonas chlororaphis]WDG82262.1 WbuC family cupin fold metalloprotein [Pseudomonas chlororaphis]WDG84684.1 WbuC family cupin fold metalloprotein [Pseudomonas chlororaphis]
MSEPSFLDQSLFAELTEKASASPRGRHHHNFHQMQEPCHRMAVGLQPSTYIPPHRHLSDDKAETLLVLKGRLGLLVFDDAGQVLAKRVLQAGGDCMGVDLPVGVYHGLVVLEPDSLMFECKAGPYRPVGDGELAAWAPREGEPGMAEYQAWMRAQFD